MGTRNKKKPITHGYARVPVVMQLEALECGAACLAMVMAYYRKWVPLETVRIDCCVSRDGSSAKNILKAARNYGFAAKGHRYDAKSIREKGQFPCIIFWNFNHFVVLCGFSGNKAVLNDPAKGTIKVPMSVFERSFSNIALLFEPSEIFQPSGKRKSVLGFAFSRLNKMKLAVAFFVVTSLIAYAFTLLAPAFNQFYVDRILASGNQNFLLPFVSVVVFAAILQLAVEWIKVIHTLRINGKLAAIGSTTYMWKVLRMPIEFFSQRMAGDILGRKSTNASIASTLVNTFAPLVLNSIMMVVYLGVMISKNWILTLVGVTTVLLNLFISRLISKRRVNITRVQSRDSGLLAGASIKGIEMVETIKSSGSENGFFQKWAGYQASVNVSKVRSAKVDAYLGVIPHFLSLLANSAVLFLGVYLVIDGQFTLGAILSFQGLMSAFMAPASNIVSAGQQIQEMRTNMERVDDVMAYPTDPLLERDTEEEGVHQKLTGNVELKNVSFGYSRLGEPLIKDFSLSLKPGSRIALVGKSGCGKSTIAKLISGLYMPWSGEILFDGKSINEIDRNVFTGSLSVVDQDICLFEDTIVNNIRMWDKTISNASIVAAVKDAQIDMEILKRPGGFEGRVAEGGKDLSGGQRQRLEIARGLAIDPSIIILDEATSALDAKTEYDVMNAIKARGITCIVIAHRLSTIRDCDEIIVLNKGEVVERGKHDELYAKGGYYADLVSNE